MLSTLIVKFFANKSENFEKIRNIWKVFFEEKGFNLLKNIFNKNWRAKNMPVVAARFAHFVLK